MDIGCAKAFGYTSHISCKPLAPAYIFPRLPGSSSIMFPRVKKAPGSPVPASHAYLAKRDVVWLIIFLALSRGGAHGHRVCICWRFSGTNNLAAGNTSESGSAGAGAGSSSEEELDDTSLGIKAKARSPRTGGAARRKPASPSKSKNSKETKKPPRAAAAAGAAGAARGAGAGRGRAGSPAPSSSSSDSSGSESSGSESSSGSSSSASSSSSSGSSSGSSASGSEDARPAASRRRGRSKLGAGASGAGGASRAGGSKAAAAAKAGPKGDAVGRGKQQEKDKEKKEAGKEVAPVKKEDGKSVKQGKEREKEAESKAAQRNGSVEGGEGRRSHKLQEVGCGTAKACTGSTCRVGVASGIASAGIFRCGTFFPVSRLVVFCCRSLEPSKVEAGRPLPSPTGDSSFSAKCAASSDCSRLFLHVPSLL